MNDITVPGYQVRNRCGRFAVGDVVVNRYKVLAELGQGGMGVVYKCFDETAGIEVALKALPPELNHSPLEMENIKENFRLVTNLVHQNIAASKNLEYDRGTGNYYLIMEYCAGESLQSWIKKKRKNHTLTVSSILPVIRQVADALDYAHGEKVIHRDIKPGNIMINSQGKIKILDFGLAAQIHSSLSRISMNCHGTSGTDAYMAPEQWRGRPQGAAADQYSLAVMTYEMLAGRLPFDCAEASVMREIVLKDTPDAIPGIPNTAQEAIMRAMRKEADERFDCCRDFVAALSGHHSKNIFLHKLKKMQEWRSAIFLAAGLVVGGIGFALYSNIGHPAEPKTAVKMPPKKIDGVQPVSPAGKSVPSGVQPVSPAGKSVPSAVNVSITTTAVKKEVPKKVVAPVTSEKKAKGEAKKEVKKVLVVKNTEDKKPVVKKEDGKPAKPLTQPVVGTKKVVEKNEAKKPEKSENEKEIAHKIRTVFTSLFNFGSNDSKSNPKKNDTKNPAKPVKDSSKIKPSASPVPVAKKPVKPLPPVKKTVPSPKTKKPDKPLAPVKKTLPLPVKVKEIPKGYIVINPNVSSDGMKKYLSKRGIKIRFGRGKWENVKNFPYKKELDAGTIRVSFDAEGFQPIPAVIAEIKKQETSEISVILEPMPIQLTFASNRKDAKFIMPDGMPYNVDDSVSIDAFRSYSILVKSEDFPEQKKVISYDVPGSKERLYVKIVRPELDARRAELNKKFAEGVKLYDQREYEKALEVLKKCGENGHAEACYRVAKIYEDGVGMWFSNKKSAYRWYENAAQLGHTESAFKIGKAISEGDISGSRKAMYRYLKQAADGKIAQAAYCLAITYENDPLITDKKMVIFYLKQAAKLNYPEAMYELGLRYENGKNIAVSIEKAIYWYEKAKMNMDKAQERLDVLKTKR